MFIRWVEQGFLSEKSKSSALLQTHRRNARSKRHENKENREEKARKTLEWAEDGGRDGWWKSGPRWGPLNRQLLWRASSRGGLLFLLALPHKHRVRALRGPGFCSAPPPQTPAPAKKNPPKTHWLALTAYRCCWYCRWYNSHRTPQWTF